MNRAAAYTPQSAEDFERLTLGIYFSRTVEALLVRITANLNGTNAPALHRLVMLEITYPHPGRIEIDLRHCLRIDRQGLDMLARLGNLARRHAGGLSITNARPELVKLFALKQLNRLVEVRS